MVLEDPATADPKQAADDGRGHAGIVVSLVSAYLRMEKMSMIMVTDIKGREWPRDDQRQDDVEFAEPEDFEDDQAKDQMFEGHHDVVINEICDVGKELILVATEKVEFLELGAAV